MPEPVPERPTPPDDTRICEGSYEWWRREVERLRAENEALRIGAVVTASPDDTEGLREQMAEATAQHYLDAGRTDRAQDADTCACGQLVDDWDEHWAAAVWAVVSPVLERQQAETERLRTALSATRSDVDAMQREVHRHVLANAEQQGEVERLRAELATVIRNWKYLSGALAKAKKEIAGRKEYGEKLRAELAEARAAIEQWEAAYGRDALPGALAQLARGREAEAAVERVRTLRERYAKATCVGLIRENTVMDLDAALDAPETPGDAEGPQEARNPADSPSGELPGPLPPPTGDDTTQATPGDAEEATDE
jgi:predicted RNase H-like nuclease (RuvC/YqgF family)